MHIDFNGLKELQALANEFPKAAASALNKTMAQVRTQAVREITAKYRIKRPDVIAKMGEVHKAWPQRLRASFISSGRRISFVYFGAKQFAKGVRVKLSKGGKTQFVRGMFIRTVHGKRGLSTHTGAFIRKGEKRLPIKEFTGPSVPQMLSGVYPKLREFANRKLVETFKHEIEWRTRKK